VSDNPPLTDTENLKLGDVVQISVQLKDKETGNPFWWRRFACVVKLRRGARNGRTHSTMFWALTLKMHPDMERDLREIDLTEELHRQVVTTVPEDRWPQGVVAMRMKLIATGKIQLGGD
jgi:hypothetical protein